MDKLIQLSLVLFLTSTTTGCSYMQQQMQAMELRSWQADRVRECAEIQEYYDDSDDPVLAEREEKAYYPGAPVLYEVVENHPRRTWELKQRVVAWNNGVYQCVCTRAVPRAVVRQAEGLDWNKVQEICLPLSLKEIK
jgi:hypothetical protein